MSTTTMGPGRHDADSGAPPTTLDATASKIVLSDASFLFSADFSRVGDDLHLTGEDGQVVVLRGYFADGELAPIWAANGARLTPEMVESLVGPRAPGQIAQVGAANPEDPIGTVAIIEGTVTATRADGTVVALQAGDAVFLGDVLVTATGANLSVEFDDGTIFSLSKNARVVLDSFVYNPGGNDNSMGVSLIEGLLVTLTGEIAPSGGITVETPVGTIGIRGTFEGQEVSAASEGGELRVFTLEDPRDGIVHEVTFIDLNGQLATLSAASNVLSVVGTTKSLSFQEESVIRGEFSEGIGAVEEADRNRPSNSDAQPDGQDQEGQADPGEGEAEFASEETGEGEAAAEAGEGEPEEEAAQEGEAEAEGEPSAEQQALQEALQQEPLETAAGPADGPSGDSGPLSSGGGGPTQDTDAAPEEGELVSDPPDNTGLALSPTPSTPGPTSAPAAGAPSGGPTASLAPTTSNSPNLILTLAPTSTINNITGSSGNDTLAGTANDDFISAAGGNDRVIIGLGGGDDVIQGGSGNDVLVVQGNADDTLFNLTAAPGDTSLLLTAGAANLTVSQVEDIEINAGAGLDVLTGAGDFSGTGLSPNTVTLSGFEAVDVSATGNQSYVINGTAGDDIYLTANGNDIITGLAGDDIIIAGGGNDIVAGGAGDDAILGGSGNDTAVFSGNSGNYTFLVSGNVLLVVDNVGSGGTDTLVQVETVLFNDGAFDVTNLFAVSVPTDANGAANSVAESAAPGALVGLRAFSVDLDATNNSVSYSIVSPGGLFAINASSGLVTLAGPLDFETAQSHQVTVRATSSDGSTADRTFTVNVTDVNEFPVGPVADSNAGPDQVAEDAPVGTLVGITAQASDPDGSNNTVTYSFTGGGQVSGDGLFAIDPNSGVVTVNGALDFETAQSHQVSVRATSSDGSTADQAFTIAVLDVADTGVTVPVDSDIAPNSVVENAGPGTSVGVTAFASDPDPSDTVGYSFANGQTVTDDGLFAIDTSSGVITAVGALDFETAQGHQVTVRATSSDTSFEDETFTIVVVDVDEFDVTTPIDNDGAPGGSVAENAAIGAAVGITAFAEDLDGSNNTVSYSFASGGQVTDDGLFAIDANSGVITVAGALDFETAQSHQVSVRATSSDQSSADETFTIAVIDVNENGVTVPVDDDQAPNSVVENLVAGASVGVTALASDPDASDTVTYSFANGLLVDSSGLFAIDATSGVITTDAPLDFETAQSHQVAVRATSTDGTFEDETFTIDVVDVDEFDVTTPIDNDGAPGGSVAENAAIGAAVGITAFAEDLDGSNNTVSYSFASGGQVTDDGLFAIDANSGVITVAGALDFETAQSHQVSVRATSSDQSSADETFTIAVIDVNEAPTVALDNAITSLPEDTDTSSPVKMADIEVTDDALGINQLTLIGADAGLFEIVDGVGGPELHLQAGVVLDFETNSVLDVTVEVDDATLGGAPDDTAPLSIAVTDVNEAPTVALTNTTTSLPEDTDTTSSVKMADIEVTDDALGTNDLTLIGADAALFEIVIGGNGPELHLRAGTVLDFQSNPVLGVTVQVDDATLGGFPDFSDSLAVAVTDVNQGVPAPLDDGPFLVDEAAGDNDNDGVFTAVSLTGESLIGNDSFGPDGPGAPVIADVSYLGGLGAASKSQDGNTIAFTVAGLWALLIFTDTGLFNFTLLQPFDHSAGDSPQGSFSYSIQDADGDVASANFTIQIDDDNGVTAVLDQETVAAGITLNGTVATNDELSADGVTYTLLDPPTGAFGTLTFNADGSYSYVANAVALGTDVFSYQVTDGDGDSAIANLEIAVTTDNATGDVVVGADQTIVGDTGTGTLTINCLDFTTASLILGNTATGMGTMTVTEMDAEPVNDLEADVLITGETIVGNFGIGTLNILAGADFRVSTTAVSTPTESFLVVFNVAKEAGSSGDVTVTGAGSSLITEGQANNIQVGLGGTGNLTVSDGGLVKTLQLDAGRGGDGTVTVTGAGSTIIASNDEGRFGDPYDNFAGFVRLGRDAGSSGILQVLAGGTLEIRPGDATSGNDDTNFAALVLAASSGTAATVLVDGLGSTLSVQNGGIQAGLAGVAGMTISGGATVTSDSDNFNNLLIGTQSGGVGTVTVTGAGSAFHATGLDNTVQVGFGDGENGSLNGGRGFLTVEQGAVVTTLHLGVGRETPGAGTVDPSLEASVATVTGLGSMIIVSNDSGRFSGSADYEAGFLRVGGRDDGGNGELNILNGGQVIVRPGDALSGNDDTTLPFVSLGRAVGSRGVIRVDGDGSLLRVEQTLADPTGNNRGPSLDVGRFGHGELLISGGGDVEVVGPEALFAVGRGTTDIGGGTMVKGSGLVTVDGTGSTLVIDGQGTGKTIQIGDAGDASLHITNDADVDFNATAVVFAQASQSTADVSVDGIGSTLNIDTGDLTIGANGIATVDVLNGAGFNVVSDGAVRIGDGAAGSSVTVSGGASLDISAVDGLEVGGNAGGSGELEVSGGSNLIVTASGFNNIVFGNNDGTGTGLFTGAGTTVTTVGTDNTIHVGRHGGTGDLTIADSAFVSTLNLEAGRDGFGTITITDAGTLVHLSNANGLFSPPFEYEAGFLRAGRDGGANGTIEILSGAQVFAFSGRDVDPADGVEDTTAPGFVIAEELDSTGSFLIRGDGSLLDFTQTSPDVSHGGPFGNVGAGGNGSMTVDQDGAFVMAGPSSSLVVGRDDGSQGTLTIASGGSASVTGADVSFGIGRGFGSLGAVTVNGTGLVASSLTVDNQGAGGDFFVGDNGQGNLTVSGGATADIAVDFAVIGNNDFSGQSSILVTGPDSSLTLSAETTLVGEFGIGTFEVDSSATATLDGGAQTFLGVGSSEGATGTLRVSSGAVLNVETDTLSNGIDSFGASIWVGNQGDGTAEIDGGAVSISALQNAQFVLGAGLLSTGTLILDGGAIFDVTTSQLSDGNATFGVNADFGSEGTGIVTISGGSVMTFDGAQLGDAFVAIANRSGSEGQVTVTGSGSQLAVLGHLAVGQGGADEFGGIDGAVAMGRLDVLLGGLVTVETLHLGGDEDGRGLITVDGANSRLQASDSISIGDPGQGTVSVTNGAVVQALDIFVNAGGTLNGDGTIDGSLTVTGGTVQPGQSPGTLTITNGGFSLDEGRLEIELTGPNVGVDTDLIQVGGDAFLNGGTVAFDLTGAGSIAANTGFNFIQVDDSLSQDLFDSSAVSYLAKGVANTFDFTVTVGNGAASFDVGTDSSLGNSVILQGGDRDDVQAGGVGADLLDGGGGNDTLGGGGGGDTLIGGTGVDHFIVTASPLTPAGGAPTTVIEDFDFVSETIEIIGAPTDDFATLLGMISDDGTDTTIDLGTGETIVLNDVLKADLTAGNFILRVTADGPISTFGNNRLLVGDIPVTPAFLSLSAAAFLFYDSISIGAASGDGTIAVDGAGTTLEAHQDIQVGDEGVGDLDITNGAVVRAPIVKIGGGTGDPNGDGALTINSGQLELLPSDTLSPELIVGASGVGELTISDGVVIVNGLNGFARVTIGQFAGAMGVATVSGGASDLRISGIGDQLVVGDAGTGTLSVTNGASVRAENIVIGANTGSIGTIVVSTGGQFFADFVEVGQSGTGTLSVSGALAFDVSARLSVGVGNGSFGEVNIGANDNLNGTIPVVVVGAQGGSTGVLNITVGGELDTDIAIVGESGTGTLDISGGVFDNTGFFRAGDFAGADGSVIVDNAGQFSARLVQIGNRLGALGTILVDGTDGTNPSSLVTSGNNNAIIVGNDFVGDGGGIGRFTISNGGFVQSGDLQVGRSAGGGPSNPNLLTVTDPGSILRVSDETGFVFGDTREGGFLRAARNAGQDGEIRVLNGGQVFVLATEADTIFGPGLQIAREDGSTGRVFVDGAGQAAGQTFIEISSPNPVDTVNGGFGPYLQVGRTGDGTLTIENGGEVRVLGHGAFAVVSQGNADDTDPNRDGEIPILAAQSNLNILSGGRLIVDSQGGAEFVGMNIGQEANANGAVLVSGENSEFIINGLNRFLNVGRDGIGELTVEAGGLVEGTFMSVGRNEGSKGTLIIDGTNDPLNTRATVSLTGVDPGGDAAFLMVGRNGSGSLTVQGGGLLQIDELVGVFPGLSVGFAETGVGVMNVTGPGSEVLIDGAQPNIGGGSGAIVVGREGEGTLNVTNGAQVVNDPAGFTFVGRESGAAGLIDVDGQGNANTLFDAGAKLIIGASFDFGTGDVLFDQGGTGDVDVRDGGLVRAGTAGDATSDILIGAGGEIQIGTGGAISGDIEIRGGSLHIGDDPGVATADVTGNVSWFSGIFSLELDASAGLSTRLDVAGSVDFLGGLVGGELLGGFLPGQGDTFTLLSASGGVTLDSDVVLALNNASTDIEAGLSVVNGGTELQLTIDTAPTGNLGTVIFGGTADDDISVNFLLDEPDAGTSDRMDGGAGADRFDGGMGSDVFTGDAGIDTLVVREGDGGALLSEADLFTDYVDGEDKIGLAGGLTFADLIVSDNAGDTAIQVSGTNEFLAVLSGADFSQIDENDFTILAIA